MTATSRARQRFETDATRRGYRPTRRQAAKADAVLTQPQARGAKTATITDLDVAAARMDARDSGINLERIPPGTGYTATHITRAGRRLEILARADGTPIAHYDATPVAR